MTQRSDAGKARTRGLSVSSQALYHWATSLPMIVRDVGNIGNLQTLKMIIFRWKIEIIFLNIAQTIDRGYTLEPPDVTSNISEMETLGRLDLAVPFTPFTPNRQNSNQVVLEHLYRRTPATPSSKVV